MFQFFRALTDRVKALFIANAGLDFEAQFISRNAERKAELLREADKYEKEGLPIIAHELHQRAQDIDLNQPLNSVLPSLEHWQAHDDQPELLPAPVTKGGGEKPNHRLLLANNGKKKQ